jgi:hypothetical protein
MSDSGVAGLGGGVAATSVLAGFFFLKIPVLVQEFPDKSPTHKHNMSSNLFFI